MQRLEDRLDDVIEASQNFGVPEAQDAIAYRTQEGVTPLIIGGTLGMLAAIQFDDELAVQRSEIANMETNLMLAAKLETDDPSAPYDGAPPHMNAYEWGGF